MSNMNSVGGHIRWWILYGDRMVINGLGIYHAIDFFQDAIFLCLKAGVGARLLA